MLENIRKDIERLVAAYEAENRRRTSLEEEVRQYKEKEETYRKRITELEQQIDNLKLKNVFLTASGDNIEAKERIEKLIRDIDRCIALMEK